MIVVYVLIIMLGFVPFLVIVYRMNAVKSLSKTGVKVMATVKEISRKSASSTSLTTVTITYPLKSTGQTVRKQIFVAGSPYDIGDRLPMYYDSKDPFKIQLDSARIFIFLIFFTLLIAAVSIWACYMIHRDLGPEIAKYHFRWGS
jgi:hypothetical protein